MRKVALILVIFVFLFGLVVSSAIAEEPGEQIEKSITKLKQVQDLLEKGDQGEAASMLAEVKSEITQVRFQLLATESERTLVGNQWVIEFPEELSIKTQYQSYSNEYYIWVNDATAENRADEKRRSSDWDVYLLDPKGIQREAGHSTLTDVLPGQAVYIGWGAGIEKSKFVPGTYTLLFKPEFESEPEELRFNIDLTEEHFSE